MAFFFRIRSDGKKLGKLTNTEAKQPENNEKKRETGVNENDQMEDTA